MEIIITALVTYQGFKRAKASANLLLRKRSRAEEQSFNALSKSILGDLNERLANLDFYIPTHIHTSDIKSEINSLFWRTGVSKPRSSEVSLWKTVTSLLSCVNTCILGLKNQTKINSDILSCKLMRENV